MLSNEPSRAAPSDESFGGPCSLAIVPGTAELRATPAAYPPAAASRPGSPSSSLPRGSPEERAAHYEVASLLGALVGFVGCAWPLLWASATSPLYRMRPGVSGTQSGLGGYLASAACALAGASIALLLVDGGAWLRRIRARPRDAPIAAGAGDATWTWHGSPGERGAELVAIGTTRKGSGKRRLTASAAEEQQDAAHMQPSLSVPVASWRRPCFEDVIAETLDARSSTHAWCIAGAGPPSQLEALDKAIAAIRARGRGAAPLQDLVRLTHSM